MSVVVQTCDSQIAEGASLKRLIRLVADTTDTNYVLPIGVEGAEMPLLFRKPFSKAVELVDFFEKLGARSVVDFGEFRLTKEAARLEKQGDFLSEFLAVIKIVDAFHLAILFKRSANAEAFLSRIPVRNDWSVLEGDGEFSKFG